MFWTLSWLLLPLLLFFYHFYCTICPLLLYCPLGATAWRWLGVFPCRLTEETFTVDEVEEMLEGLRAVVRGEVETELIKHGPHQRAAAAAALLPGWEVLPQAADGRIRAGEQVSSGLGWQGLKSPLQGPLQAGLWWTEKQARGVKLPSWGASVPADKLWFLFD